MQAATPKPRRTLFAFGALQRRTPRAGRIACTPEHHAGPFTRNLTCEGWLGCAWWECAACGSTIVLGSAPEVAA